MEEAAGPALNPMALDAQWRLRTILVPPPDFKIRRATKSFVFLEGKRTESSNAAIVSCNAEPVRVCFEATYLVGTG